MKKMVLQKYIEIQTGVYYSNIIFTIYHYCAKTFNRLREGEIRKGVEMNGIDGKYPTLKTMYKSQ